MAFYCKVRRITDPSYNVSNVVGPVPRKTLSSDICGRCFPPIDLRLFALRFVRLRNNFLVYPFSATRLYANVILADVCVFARSQSAV